MAELRYSLEILDFCGVARHRGTPAGRAGAAELKRQKVRIHKWLRQQRGLERGHHGALITCIQRQPYLEARWERSFVQLLLGDARQDNFVAPLLGEQRGQQAPSRRAPLKALTTAIA
jgi:hypothetical protein